MIDQVSSDNDSPSVIYERIWRNKWLTSTATTMGEMSEFLRGAAEELREIEKAGVVLEQDGGVGDDYARLTTTDRDVAERFGFEEWRGDESDE